MKKILLLLLFMMFGQVIVNAADWQPVLTNVPGVAVYVDLDSIKRDYTETYYAIRYRVNNKPEQIAYIKSSQKTNYLGIIESGDFDEEKYRPNAVFNDSHVFMKPIKEGSFLNSANHYIMALNDRQTVADKNDYFSKNEIPVSYNSKDILTPAELDLYLASACNILEENWIPPVTGQGSRTIIVLTIGRDGSLLNYKFKEYSGDRTTDRSVVSAAEKSVPFPKFPDSIHSNIYSLDFQFVFEHNHIKKSVVH